MKEKFEKLEKKNLIIIGIFIISIVIILFGGALIYNKFFFKKSYSDVEKIMLNAAKEYYSENSEKLPQNINDTISLSDSTLVKAGKMDTIESYTKNKKNTCEGEVTVTNVNGNYRYAAILDCGNNYQTQTLTEYIKENVEIINSGYGLYELNNELVYRGEKVDNYLKLSGKIYRIVKFKDGHPVIILTDHSEKTQWDNHYNIETDNNNGINDYESSRMLTYLTNLYNDDSENALLSESAKLLVTSYNLPIGRRSNQDNDKTGRLENAVTLTDQYIGLLPVSDFLNASTDENCTTTISKSCSNYNYLNKFKETWWTITANSKNSYKVYTIQDIPGTAFTNEYATVRPVLYLAKDAIYVSGDGSKDNPFEIK